MASLFPGGIDAFPTNHQDDAGEVIHAATVNDLADATNKIEGELGANPSGSLATVAAITVPLIGISTASVADQTANAADTYITPNFAFVGRIQAGSFFRWRFHATKTAAGVAAPIFTVRVGTAGTTADTARLTLTSNAQTAAADSAIWELETVVRVASASGVLSGAVKAPSRTTGFSNGLAVTTLQATSGTFDLTVANSKIGVSINPGASGVWTITEASFTAHNLSG
jgi:3D (Asp-Asp-Asp) domain-containing protein